MRQNTFIKLIRKKNKRATSNTAFHILNEQRKNPVFIKERLTYTHPLQIKEKGHTRADVSRRLSSAKSRLKKHKLALIVLKKEGVSTAQKERKKKAIRNTEDKIFELKKEKEQTIDRRKYQLHYTHVEVIFEITNTMKFKTEEYLKDLHNAGKGFLEERFAGSNIKVSVGHLHQEGSPHIHMILEYCDGYNLTKDLNYIYGKKQKQYSDLQVDFNEFIKGHRIVKKYGFDLDDIVRGGRKKYLSLDKFKKISKEVNTEAKKEVNSLFKSLVYYSFGFIKIPTLNSLKRVKQALYKNIREKLTNAKLPDLVNILLKKNEELTNREYLSDIKIEGLEDRLKQLKIDFKKQTFEMDKLQQLNANNEHEISNKATKIMKLNKQISELQIKLTKPKPRDFDDK